MATITLNVTGMKCGGCEKTVINALKALSGVTSAQASQTSGTVEVRYDEAAMDLETIKQTIRGKGYEVS